MMDDPDPDWLWWRRKLAGEDMQANESNPHAGTYQWVRKTGYGSKKYAIPVAYWFKPETGELNCRVGFKDVTPQHGRDIWISVHNHPVPLEWYRDVTEKEPPDLEWRDGLGTTAPIGDNLPPDETSIEWLTEKIQERADEAKSFLDGPAITEQVQADRIGNTADHLAELWKAVEEARKSERKPLDEAIKEIQARWTPLLHMAEVYKNLKYKLLTPWLMAQKKAQEEEAKAAEAAGEPMPEQQARRPRAGTRGRAMTLRTFKVAEITDYDLCLQHFKGHDDVRNVIQDLANKAIRVGIEVPGAKLIEDQKVV